jgi:molecular chaperone DnaK
MSKSNKIIGIDLGSSNSAVSIIEGGEVKTIPNSEGLYTTPSWVAFTKDGIKVGDSAKRQANMNPENTIYNIKRLMGKTYDQVKDLKRPYKIVNSNGRAAVQIGDRVYSPEEISAMILQKLKKTAEDYLGEEITRAVITVPAFFNNEEREATKNAGIISNLQVERIISEPTAGCLNVKYPDDTEKTVIVVDAGGSTVDISVVNISDNIFEIVSTHGDLDLGGFLVDEAIINYVATEFLTETGFDLRKDTMSLQRLIEASEKLKCELSSSPSSDISLPYITVLNGVPLHLNKTISRSKFEQLIEFFNNRIIDLCDKCLKKENIDITSIDDILLVGGSCRIPSLQTKLEEFFGKKLNKTLNLDLCVSEGAALQGGVLTGETTDILLLDVLPISLGIETFGSVFTKMIDGNTTIPTEKTEVYSTASDNQTSVEIHVLQGERTRASDNKSLGKFTLDGIPPGMRGTPQIEVKFSVDANSILTVTAREKNTGKQQSIRIDNKTSLTKEEIERMKSEAEANAEADKKFKEEVEKLNAVESTIFQAEKQFKEYGDKVTPATKSSVETLIKDLIEAKNSKDFTKMDSLTTSLNQELSKFYGEIQSNSATTEAQTEASETPQDAETVDYEEVK